jgi:nuclear pore complex protein Nup214
LYRYNPGEAGLKAVLDDMNAAMGEADAMLEDVSGLVSAVENGGGGGAGTGGAGAAPFEAAAISALSAEAEELAARVSEEVMAAGALRPGVAEVWVVQLLKSVGTHSLKPPGFNPWT